MSPSTAAGIDATGVVKREPGLDAVLGAIGFSELPAIDSPDADGLTTVGAISGTVRDVARDQDGNVTGFTVTNGTIGIAIQSHSSGNHGFTVTMTGNQIATVTTRSGHIHVEFSLGN